MIELSPETVEALKRAGEVLATQAEDVAHQAVVYGRVLSFVEGVIYLGMWGTVVKGFRWMKVNEWDSRDNRDLVFLALWTASFLLVCISVPVASDVILPWVAPKVYLLKLLVVK